MMNDTVEIAKKCGVGASQIAVRADDYELYYRCLRSFREEIEKLEREKERGISAKSKYIELDVDSEITDPLERLRAFCSFAFRNGDDWLYCERFFDEIAEAIRKGDKQ